MCERIYMIKAEYIRVFNIWVIPKARMIQIFLTTFLIGEKAVNGQMGHRCQWMKESYVKTNMRLQSSVTALLWLPRCEHGVLSSSHCSLIKSPQHLSFPSAHPACLVWVAAVAPQTSSWPLQGWLFPCKQWTVTSQLLSNHPISQSPSGSMSIHPHYWNRCWWISLTVAKYVNLSTFIINYLLTIPWFWSSTGSA